MEARPRARLGSGVHRRGDPAPPLPADDAPSAAIVRRSPLHSQSLTPWRGYRADHSQSLTPNAEDLYRKALGIAEEQEAKLWELRGAASLARLRRDEERRAEARDLLAPVYGWFTEGFGTRDLKEAKALLDELTCAGPPA